MDSNDVISHDAIRQRARALWERAGQPEGQDMAHWLQAESELRAEREKAGAGGEFDPGKTAIPTTPSTQKSEPAAGKSSPAKGKIKFNGRM